MVSESFNSLQAPAFLIEPISYSANSTTTDNLVDQLNLKISEDETKNDTVCHRSFQRSLSMDFTTCIQSRQKSVNKSDGDLLNFHL